MFDQDIINAIAEKLALQLYHKWGGVSIKILKTALKFGEEYEQDQAKDHQDQNPTGCDPVQKSHCRWEVCPGRHMAVCKERGCI
jgi:hypothetical protein